MAPPPLPRPPQGREKMQGKLISPFHLVVIEGRGGIFSVGYFSSLVHYGWILQVANHSIKEKHLLIREFIDGYICREGAIG